MEKLFFTMIASVSILGFKNREITFGKKNTQQTFWLWPHCSIVFLLTPHKGNRTVTSVGLFRNLILWWFPSTFPASTWPVSLLLLQSFRLKFLVLKSCELKQNGSGVGRARFAVDLGKVTGSPFPEAIVILVLEGPNYRHFWESTAPDCPALPALFCIVQAERKTYNHKKSKIQPAEAFPRSNQEKTSLTF